MGIDSSNMWVTMLDPSCTKFFGWLQDNLMDDNILTAEQLSEHEYLAAHNQLLSPDEVEAILAEAEAKYPGIFDPNIDRQIEEAECQLKEARDLEARYELLASSMKLLADQAEKDAAKHKAAECRAEKALNHSVEQCLSAARTLENLETENRSMSKELFELYTQRQSPPTFMFQMPFYRFNKNCSEFKNLLKAHLEENILPNPEDLETNVQRLKRAKDGWLEALQNQLKTDLDVATYESLQKLQQLPMPTNLDKIDFDSSAGDTDKSHALECLESELQEETEQLVQLKIDAMLAENVKFKAARAESRIQHILALSQLVASFVNVAEALWVLLTLEKQKISLPDEAVRGLSQKRISAMRRIQRQKLEIEPEQQFVQYLREFLGMDATRSVEDLVKSWSQLVADVKQKMLFLCATNVDMPQNLWCEMQKAEDALRRFVFGGPINRPLFVDPRLNTSIQAAKDQVEQVSF